MNGCNGFPNIILEIFLFNIHPISRLWLSYLAGGDVVTDDVILGVMDTAAPKHEAVHAHSEMLTLCLETLPDKHARSWHSRHLAWPGRDLVAT